MIRVLIAALLVVVLSGCACELWQHDTMYKNMDHLRFSQNFESVGGFNHPTAESHRMSQEQGWWGCEIKYKGE